MLCSPVHVRRYSNNTDVEIRPYKFGTLEGVAALDPQLPKSTGTYAAIIEVSIVSKGRHDPIIGPGHMLQERMHINVGRSPSG